MAMCTWRLARVIAVVAILHDTSALSARRKIVAVDGQFRQVVDNETVVLKGANVVMKGPPWLPSTELKVGDLYCIDTPTETCKTFTRHDAEHITSKGWNFIRLGVTWAGAQPTVEPVLNVTWVKRLQSILTLCERYNISVVLDMHQDALGTALCGEGVPMWFSKLATPTEIGKPLWPLPAQTDGKCGLNDTASWALHAGDDNYNVVNPCCLRHNQGGWSSLIATRQAQSTLHYLFTNPGRQHFVTYMGLLARAVANHSAAIGIELMNEPPEINMGYMYETWKEAYTVIRAEIPDIAVGIMDPGEAPLPATHLLIPVTLQSWIRNNTTHLFYAFHWYSTPADPAVAVKNAVAIAKAWGIPALMTEFMSCKVQAIADAANIGWSYWHYSQYCNTPPSSQCIGPASNCTFGACITGWGAGDSNHTC
eukprot:m.261509 g.261509  ORF g.261509 m.261509 type:complete len:423 (+) comp42299_c0_seq1:38-1306(+)